MGLTMKALEEGFSVKSSDTAEVNPIKNLKEFGYIEPDMFSVDYRLTSKCNYNCWYCTDLHDNSKKHLRMDEHTLSRLTELVEVLDRDIRFYMYGGEPTIHQDFVEIAINMIRCLKPGSLLEIQTNLWIKSPRLEKICQQVSEESARTGVHLSFLCSYHYGECSFPEFLKSCRILKKYGMLKQITVMYQTDHGESVIKDFKILKSLYPEPIRTELLPLLCGSVDEKDPNPYKEVDGFYSNPDAVLLGQGAQAQSDILQVTLEDDTTYMTNASLMWKQRSNCFQGFKCHVGDERIVINGEGEVYRCFNEIFDKKQLPQFNIFDEKDKTSLSDYVSSLKPIVCPYPKCYFEFSHKKIKL